MASRYTKITSTIICDRRCCGSARSGVTSEADVLILALFGQIAAQWREANPDKTGNMRDEADVAQLVCLYNLENLNARFITEIRYGHQ